MIRDKSLDIFLIFLFGVGGIAILILAWAQPLTLPERIMTTFVGSIGIFWMLVRALVRKSPQADASAEPVPVEVKSDDNQ